ncbi:MAG: hypothetical protein OCC46_08060 [Pseudodesulfovibrio sp.]
MSNNKKTSKVELAMAMVKKLKTLTDGKTTYALLGEPGTRTELTTIPSGSFSKWLTHELYEQHTETCTPQVLRQVEAYLEQTAKADAPVKINRRLGIENGEYCVDLGNYDCNDMIKIGDGGWSLEQPNNTVFAIDDNLDELATPSVNGDPFLLFKYLNVRDDKHRMLILAWLCALPLQINHPILLLKGIQASGKTTAAEFLRKVFDNSKSLIMSVPGTESELALAFFTNTVCLFDNMGKINDSCADMFCKAVTGSGYAKRKLYTDSDQVIYKYRRPIIITSINWPTEKSDFLSRCMTIPMTSIPSKRNQSTEFIKEQFDKELPYILGGLLDLLVKGMNLKHHVKLKHKSRMVGFDKIGCGIALAAGYDPAEFMEARLELQRDSFFFGNQRPFFLALDQLLKESGGAITMNAEELAKDISARLLNMGCAEITELSLGTKLSRTKERLAQAKITYTKKKEKAGMAYTIKAAYPSKENLVEVITNCRTCKHLDMEIFKTEYCNVREQIFSPPEGPVECPHYELNLRKWEIEELRFEDIVFTREAVNMDTIFGTSEEKKNDIPKPPSSPQD